MRYKVSPIMTSNNTPSPYVVSASHTSGSLESWKIFDDNKINNSNRWASSNPSVQQWIQIDLGVSETVDEYILTTRSSNFGTESPKKWFFSGSKDGFTWVLLDSRENQTWTASESKTFTFKNYTAYRYYRITVQENGGSSDYVTIQEVELYKTVINKTLISLSSGEYKTFENSSWSTVSTLPPTREIFETKGIEDLSTVSQSAWELLSKEYSTVELVTYVPEGNTVSNFSNTYEALEMNLQLKGLPVGQMVFSKKTVLYGNLTQAIVNQLDEGLPNGIIRLLVSFDRGETWRIYSEGLWKEVYPLTEASFIEKGMTMSDLALLGKDDFRLGTNDEICFAYYIEEDIRRNDSAKLTDLSLKQKTTINTVEVSDASLYILNTASTINISLTGTELSGKISDIDLGKVKYRVLLNGNPYYPADGKFTDFQPTPLDISLRIDGKSVLIDKSNTLIVEFEDYWGSTDFWSTTFIGTYSGLIFKDPTGEAYATEIGQVLKYLDIGTLIAGQKSEEFEIHLENSYGYDVKNPKIVSQTENEGVVFELSKSNSPFNAKEELVWDGEFKNGESLKFYLRIVTSVKTPPVMGGAFELIVNADKV